NCFGHWRCSVLARIVRGRFILHSVCRQFASLPQSYANCETISSGAGSQQAEERKAIRGHPSMPAPSFQHRRVVIVVPVAGAILAIEAAAWTGSLGEGLELVLLLSIAWIPAVFLLLDPKVAGWILVAAIFSSIMSLAFTLWSAAHRNFRA